jgi:two-component system alkaline phosphatase synthesis response regulator PhoP
MKKKILVIDDDKDILEAIKLTLEDANFMVTTESDVKHWPNFFKKDLPNLIILDVLLGGNDGRKIALELKSKSTTKHIPIIMVSAHPSAKNNALLFKADDFLEKPFNIEDLVLLVNKYIY